MADIDVVRKQDGAASTGGLAGGGMTWLWAAIAILSVAGLMAWLAIQSNRITTAAVVQEGAPAGTTPGAAGAAGDAETAELAAVAGAPDTFVGRRLRVENVGVAATLGPSAFWGDIPGANPFLVLFSPNVTIQPQLEGGQRYTVQGIINEVTEADVDQWVQSGAIRPGARDEAAFATHYLLAEQIVR
jgi:hypothetical protein